MDIIEYDHRNDCETCCSRMLSEWLDNTPHATWENLINATDNLSSSGMCIMCITTALESIHSCGMR